MKTVFLVALLSVLPAHGRAQGIDNAISLYEHGKFQSAAESFSNLARKSPDDAHLRLWTGKAYLKLRRWDDAIREFEKAVELDPKNGVDHLWLARAYGRKAEHVFLLRAPGLASQSRKEFETAAQLAPDNEDIRFDLLDFYLQAPGIVGGGKEKAEAQAREIARISPRAGYTARAQIYADNKEWDRALRELVQATAKFPSDPAAYVDLAEFQLEHNDFAGTEASAQKARALSPSNSTARLYLAAAQIQLQRNVPLALGTLQEMAAGPLTDNDPSFEEVYYWLGRAYMAQGKNAEARKAFETSLGFDPDYSRSKETLARIR
jgi:predicted Zn-dependent protease